MMKYKCLLFFVLLSVNLFAQDDLLDELEGEMGEEKQYAVATFKGTRMNNGHTVKSLKKGELEFLISHRFGRVNSGFNELFGLDNSYIHLSFDYGITDNLTVGMGRSSVDKTYDSFIKYKVLRQAKAGSPVTVTALVNTSVKTFPSFADAPDWTFANRVAYGNSLLIARKFNSKFSLQVMPVWVHKNRVVSPDINNTYALGTAFRFMVTHSVSINGEYYHRMNAPEFPDAPRYNPIALGVDIETGGHVFQLQLTNTRGMFERAFITETDGDFFGGDIHFGFNISRTFQVKH